MKNYMILMPEEDGDIVNLLEVGQVEDLNQLMEDFGITKWRDSFGDLTRDTNPQYWGEGEAMLLSYEIKVPKPVKVVEEYKLDSD